MVSGDSHEEQPAGSRDEVQTGQQVSEGRKTIAGRRTKGNSGEAGPREGADRSTAGTGGADNQSVKRGSEGESPDGQG